MIFLMQEKLKGGWDKARKYFAAIIAWALFLATLIQISPAKAQSIPRADRVNWPGAGLWSSPPAIADTVLQINLVKGVTWDDKVQTAIAQAKSWIDAHSSRWAILYFPPGSYTLTREIALDQNHRNIVFQGAGSDKTTLRFDFGGTKQRCFAISGSDPGPTQPETNKRSLAVNLDKDSTAIRCSAPIGIITPCWIRLCEEGHPYHEDWARYCVGQITRLERANGNEGTLKDAASKEYAVDRQIKIWPIAPVMNIGIENLKIWRTDEGFATEDGGNNVHFTVAVNCWVKGVWFEQTTRNHIWIDRSSHIYISGCYFHGAQHYCDNYGGGYGYGVALSTTTTNCLVENNIFDDLRHAMLVQAGANCNVFAFNYSYHQYWEKDLDFLGCNEIPGDLEFQEHGPGGDVSIHGNYPYANLFEQNYCERIVADGTHGENGKWNAIVRNRLTNDFDSDRSWVRLKSIPYATALGNMRSHNDASEVTYYYCDPYRDYFGYLDSIGRSHNYFAGDEGDELDAVLADVSYFYSARPGFLPSGFSWPSIGPKTSSGSASLSQAIPAKTRFSESIKTYIDAPTPSYLTRSGVLSYNQTWSGIHDLTGDVIVPADIILTILPGTTVRIPQGKSITVQGILVAQGTSDLSIIFDKSGTSNWYGIRIENGSRADSCLFEHCLIKNASFGLYCNGSRIPRIQYSTITDCAYGIYSYYASPRNVIQYNEIMNNICYGVFTSHSDSLRLSQNDIHNFGANIRCEYDGFGLNIFGNKIHATEFGKDGVWLTQAFPILQSNMIYDNGRYGVYCSTTSVPEFIGDSGAGRNVIAYNASYGIMIDSTSMPLLGGEVAANSLYGNEKYDVYSLHSDTAINATHNYWGFGPPRVYGNVDTNNELDRDPNHNPQGLGKSSDLSAALNNSSEAHLSDNDKARSRFSKGYGLELAHRYDDAVSEFQSLIEEYPGSDEASMALVHIALCNNKSGNIIGTRTILENVTNRHSDYKVGAKAKELEAPELVKEGRYADALANYSFILENFPTDRMARSALFETWQIHFNFLKDEGLARVDMERHASLYPDDDLTIMMKVALGDITNQEVQKIEGEKYQKLIKGDSLAVLRSFVLYRNYPNPFNQGTEIIYSLPGRAQVLIEIYNVLAQKIARIYSAEMSEGKHVIFWDGQDEAGKKVAAGIYFCRVQAGEIFKTIKMTMLP